VVNSDSTKNYEKAGEWSHKLMNYGFQNNCCTIIAFSPSEGGSGHAVAVHQKAADEFVFFDPNYGAFRYSKENLKHCFQHLFWTPYIKATKDVLDGEKAVYLRRVKQTDKVEGRWDKMGYTIFGV
jgi:Yersinia/Haemophilus virulence surface antigen